MCNRDWTVKVFMAVLGVLTCTASALAQGGNVLPACATPKGYSLSRMAKETAVYFTGINSGNPLTPPPPHVPFEIVVAGESVTVKPGTMLYVPGPYADNSPPVFPGFPTDIHDQAADAAYIYTVFLALYDVTDFIVQVDGQTTILDADCIRGVRTPPLLDGGGDEYIVNAVFLTPLTPGEHTVGVGGIVNGEPVVFATTNVTVR